MILYRDWIFVEHRLPEKVISDRGSQFVSKFMKELYKVLGIKGNPSTAYHPQTDGQTEQVNQEVKEFLTIFVNEKQDNWSDLLSMAQFCHNDQKHLATNHSPFYLTYGYHPKKGLEPKWEYKVEAVGEFMEWITEARKSAKEALEQANTLMKNQYDKHRRPAINYKTGDKVYIKAEHLPSVRPTKKLNKKYYRPYEVIEKVGPSAYRIKILISWEVYNIFNEILLKPYHTPTFPCQIKKEKETKDQQDAEDHENNYEVETLLDS